MSDKPESHSASRYSYEAIATVLNSLDALVYVADMQTYEVLFFNDYGLSIWGDYQGRKCYEVLQAGQSQPCAFCTNDKLLDADGQPTGVYTWEFQNTVNKRWYQCRDQAIRWIDGRLVRMEIATDITDRKAMEEALSEAKARAEQLADTDELTGLNNRRAFFNYGNMLLQQSLRAGQSLAVIMYDLDHFKRVNDHWGHAAGDAVLVQLAKTSRECVRASDVLARLGGEEFAIVLPNVDAAQALNMAERLRQAIASQRVEYEGNTIQCTVSLGVAIEHFPQLDQAGPDSQRTAPTLGQLLNRADVCLFKAKESGRDRVYMEDGTAETQPGSD